LDTADNGRGGLSYLDARLDWPVRDSSLFIKGTNKDEFPERFLATTTSRDIVQRLGEMFPVAELHTKCHDCDQKTVIVRNVQTCVSCGHDKEPPSKRAKEGDDKEKEEEDDDEQEK